MVKTVTSLARAPGSAASGSQQEAASGPRSHSAPIHPDVQVETVVRPEEKRPGGRRFGALVHSILAAIDLEADAAETRALAAMLQRMFDATQEEIDAAIVTVGAALQHPVLRRAAAAGKENTRRETPVLLTLEGGSLVEGVVDLAFRESAPDFCGWTVVDFKTDQEFSGESPRYVRQVNLYAEAVRAATGSPTRGLILVI
jgi:ATP-dependent exoDNAse (exonuclease V) beta subunit